MSVESVIPQLRFVTVISNDGITIFHKTYAEEDLDEYLFSGFSSAMIAFSKELGDELNIIKMANQSLFYHEVNDDGVLILSIENGYDTQLVIEKLKMLSRSDNLNLMLEGSKIGIMQNENELFEVELEEYFEVKQTSQQAEKDLKEDTKPKSVEKIDQDEEDEMAFLEALDELNSLD